MKTEPLVTVILPTHNHAPFIAQAIESILEQETEYPFDILLHDDASTDGTADICRDYAVRYPDRITLIAQTVNQYQFDRRIQSHILFPLVKAKYTAILDGDDYWCDKQKLQKQVGYLEAHPDCTMCIASGDQVDVNGNLLFRVKPYAHDCMADVNDMIRGGGNFCATGTIVAPTALLNAMPEFTMVTEVEDVPVQLWGAVEGYIWYFADRMVVYRAAVPGSWSARQFASTLPTRLETHRTVRELLIGFDAYTKGKYHDAFAYAIGYQEFQTLCLTHDMKALKSPPYRAYYERLSAKRRARLWAEKLFPHLTARLIERMRQQKQRKDER